MNDNQRTQDNFDPQSSINGDSSTNTNMGDLGQTGNKGGSATQQDQGTTDTDMSETDSEQPTATNSNLSDDTTGTLEEEDL